jgi:hypothetical protein
VNKAVGKKTPRPNKTLGIVDLDGIKKDLERIDYIVLI